MKEVEKCDVIMSEGKKQRIRRPGKCRTVGPNEKPLLVLSKHQENGGINETQKVKGKKSQEADP